jgi:hypothetical protein
MENIYFLKNYCNKENRIELVLNSNLHAQLPLEEDMSCLSEAKVLIELYRFNQEKFKELAKSFLEYHLEVEEDKIQQAVNKIEQIIRNY